MPETEAREEGTSVSALIARMLSDGLKRREPEPERSFRLVVVGEGGTQPGVELDRPRLQDLEEDLSSFGGRRSDD